MIESSDFSGRDRRVVLNLGDGRHAFGISVIDQSVYWTDWMVKDLLKADKLTGQNNVVLGKRDFTRPNALFAVTNASIPSGQILELRPTIPKKYILKFRVLNYELCVV